MSEQFEIQTLYTVYGADEVIAAQRQIIEEFKAGKLSVEEFTAASRENMEATRALNRAYRDIGMAYRVQHYELLQFTRALQTLGHIGRDVVQMWQAYTISQIRLEQVQERIREAHEDILGAQQDMASATERAAYWQEEYNRRLEVFGEDSAYTKDALDNLKKALDDQEEAQRRLEDAYRAEKKAIEDAERARQEHIMGYVGMGLQVAGDVALIIGHWNQIKLAIEAATGAVSSFGAAIGSLGLAYALHKAVYEPWIGYVKSYMRELGIPPEIAPEWLRKAMGYQEYPGAEQLGSLQKIISDIYGAFQTAWTNMTGYLNWLYNQIRNLTVNTGPLVPGFGVLTPTLPTPVTPPATPTPTQINIEANIGPVSKEVDADSIADKIAWKIEEKLGRHGW